MLALADRLGARWLSSSSSISDDTPLLPTRALEVRGKTVRVADVGAGPPVLCLHGYPDTLQVFARLAHAGAGRVVAADFPGQGCSAVDVDVTAPAARAARLLALLDGLGLKRVSVFAHDMGAMAALELALLATGRVERLVISNALLSSSAPTSMTLRLLRASGSYRFFLPAFPRAAVARCLKDFLPPSNPLSAAVRADIEQAFAQSTVAATTVAVCDAAERWLQAGLQRFAGLQVPTELLWSAAGGHFPRAHAEHVAAAIGATARVVDVDGGRHWLVWQDPARVAVAFAHR